MVPLQVAKHFGLSNVHVHAEDMLSSSLHTVDVLVLTNQCWDDDLVVRCADKVGSISLGPGVVAARCTTVPTQALVFFCMAGCFARVARACNPQRLFWLTDLHIT
jgi:hypothetical protein